MDNDYDAGHVGSRVGSNEYQQDETEHAFPYRPYGI